MADTAIGLTLVDPTLEVDGTDGVSVLTVTNDIVANTADQILDAQTINIVLGTTQTEPGFDDIVIFTGDDPALAERTLTASAFGSLVLNLGAGDLDNSRAPGRPTGDAVVIEGDFSTSRLTSLTINGDATSANGADGIDLSLLEGDYSLTGFDITVNGGAGDDEFVAALESVSGIQGVTQSFDGGTGFDEIDFSFASFDLFIDLTGPTDLDGYVVINSEDVGLTNSVRVKNVELILGGAGNDTFIGGAGQQAFSGGDGDDHFFGGAGPDEMDGDAGNDTFHGDAGADTYVGGAGIDTVTYATSLAAVTVDLAAVDARGRPAAQVGGDATGDALTGIENVVGSDLATRADRLLGNGQANTLEGLAGNDTLNGRGGNDILDGGLGADSMTGGAGNDTFIIDNTGDRAIENSGQGTDTVSSSTITLSLANYANVENATLTGALNINLQGTSGANVLTGNDGNNSIAAGGGADVLIGGLGADILDGAAGADIFRYLSELDTGVGAGNRDVLRTFTLGQDKIDLSEIDADPDFFSPGQDPFIFIGNSAFSGTVGELNFFQQGSGATAMTVIGGDLDGNGVADFEIQLTGLVNLTAGDFIFG